MTFQDKTIEFRMWFLMSRVLVLIFLSIPSTDTHTSADSFSTGNETNKPVFIHETCELGRVHTNENARKKHETEYFRKPYLYKNIAIYPLCSRKKKGFFAWTRLYSIYASNSHVVKIQIKIHSLDFYEDSSLVKHVKRTPERGFNCLFVLFILIWICLCLKKNIGEIILENTKC